MSSGTVFRYTVVGLLCLSALPLLAVPGLKWVGWVLLGSAIIALMLTYRDRFSQDMLVLAGGLALLGIAPISTDISYGHMALMASLLSATVILPYLITRKVYKRDTIKFPWRMGRRWLRAEIAYVIVAGAVAYLALPYYLAETGSYLNWTASLETSSVIRLFLGTNALGIWDELFFVGVCLALLRQHLPFWRANVAQAWLWTTFLYELGFRGWGPLPIFLFALSQGYIFRKSKSLLYIITVHLTVDFILFLVLIHLHNPDSLRIFITSPF